MKFFDRTQPLWLPAGSVRALLALGVVSAYIVLPAFGMTAPPVEVVTAVLAFYFGQRGAAPNMRQPRRPVGQFQPLANQGTT